MSGRGRADNQNWPTARTLSEEADIGDYIPPPANETGVEIVEDFSGDSNRAAGGYVTQPPRPRHHGLTGKISTLFRREASRERGSLRSPPTSPPRGGRGSRGGSSSAPNSPGGGSSKSGREPAMRSRDSAPRSPTAAAVASGSSWGKKSKGRVVDASDDRSVASGASSKRIFYSSHADEDSDDSFESRVSRNMNRSTRSLGEPEATDEDYNSRNTGSLTSAVTAKTILRYRGFSTSIKSLFLDETVVCASMGCFGLILSSRTEYLLNLRNERRGALSPSRKSGSESKKKLPSRIVAYGLAITLALMMATFVVWGFGTGNGLASAYYSAYYYDADQDAKQQQQQQNAYDSANADEDESDDIYSQWDDYLSSNSKQNYVQGDDGSQNDDYAAQNDDNSGKGGGSDDYYTQNNDDQSGGYSNNGQGDDYYNNRRAVTTFTRGGKPTDLEVSHGGDFAHPLHGVYKLRDVQENLWDPVYQFIQDEWDRKPSAALDGGTRHRRDQYDSQVDDMVLETRRDRDTASNIRVALFFAFLLFLGVLGRRRRMRTRFYLVRARAQEDHLYYASTEVGEARRVAFEDTREDQYEGACSHTLCGCYPVDEQIDTGEYEDVEVTDNGIFKTKKKPFNEDIVARAFNVIMAACCGFLCRCWFQCLSICALAQEAREIRLLVPPRYQRIDFITHQPFHEYQKEVNDLRRGWLGKIRPKAGIRSHFNALSRLSRYILVTFSLCFIIVVATLLFNPRAAFSWQDAVVLGATFIQAFFVLFFVHWIFHKSDLSLDAVIKLFAAGFVIAVPAAFFFEGLLVNIVLFVAWSFYSCLHAIRGEDFVNWVFEHWRAIWIAGELFNAYVVAAVTEELCKYYTFRSIEHPDLIFLTGLNRNKQADGAVEGGLVKYPFASHQVQELNRENSFESDSQYSQRSGRKSAKLIERTGTREDEFDEDELDVRTFRQRAMAITTGMICVAVGLACAENFLYVFVLGGATQASSTMGNEEESYRRDILEEWIVLFFRSIFPIHALSAALQSINMIRKFVETDTENGHRIGVGRIILPAVIVHGTFDAILMGINVYQETAWDRYLEENDGNIGDDGPYNVFVLNIVAWISITAVMLGGLLWYYREYRAQNQRLKVLEERERVRMAEEQPGWDAQALRNEFV